MGFFFLGDELWEDSRFEGGVECEVVNGIYVSLRIKTVKVNFKNIKF